MKRKGKTVTLNPHKGMHKIRFRWVPKEGDNADKHKEGPREPIQKDSKP